MSLGSRWKKGDEGEKREGHAICKQLHGAQAAAWWTSGCMVDKWLHGGQAAAWWTSGCITMVDGEVLERVGKP